jgi:hypothetical protein
MKTHGFSVLLAMAALALLPSAPMWADAATPATPGATTTVDDAAQVLAVYSGGGKVTIAQATAKTQEMAGQGRALATFTSPESMYEVAAKSLAVREILLKKAADLKLQEMPGWAIAEKLIESNALATAMLDSTWFGVTPTEAEIAKFTKDNPEMSRPLGPSTAKNGQKAAATDWSMPNQHDFVAWQIRGERTYPTTEALAAEAKSKCPVVCADPKEPTKSEGDTALMRCGNIALTSKDVKALSDLIGAPIDKVNTPVSVCSQLCTLGESNEDLLSQGELARLKGYGSRPEFAAAWRLARENWLAWVAKTRLMQEWLASYPSEADVKNYYDNKYNIMEEQQITFEALLSPVAADGQDTTSAREKARAAAADAIAKIKQGSSFDDVLKEHPEFQYMPASARSVDPADNSGFNQQAPALKAGEVAAEPVEDYGGFCVVRVTDSRLRRKMPLENARGQIVSALQFDYRSKITSDFEGTLLEKHQFAIQKDAMTQASLQASQRKGD